MRFSLEPPLAGIVCRSSLEDNGSDGGSDLTRGEWSGGEEGSFATGKAASGERMPSGWRISVRLRREPEGWGCS